MRSQELREMYEVETAHWWFAGKRVLFAKLLERRLCAGDLHILDAGCGTGAVAADFGRYGAITAMDRSLEALRLARSRGLGCLVNGDAASFPFAEACFDLVLAFDVIEHVEDDAGFIAAMAASLKPGGALAVHVPAWPFMWSRHDEILEHKRRYTRRGLRELLLGQDLVLEHLGWSNCSIFVPAAAVRLLRRAFSKEPQAADLAVVPRPLNTALLGLAHAEAAMARAVGLPFGLSLAAVARKR